MPIAGSDGGHVPGFYSFNPRVVVLNKIRENPGIAYSELRVATGLRDETLARVLQGLTQEGKIVVEFSSKD